ncbi:hypothetical protein Tco_0125973 [Tanacetum coccineum]
MKKLKENVHAIQVGCQNYGGAHLDKGCTLKEEVKSIEEAKYGEFRRPSPFSNRCNTPKNGSHQNMFPGALLHSTIAPVRRERPLSVVEKKRIFKKMSKKKAKTKHEMERTKSKVIQVKKIQL